MSTVTCTIDGHTVTVPAGTNVIEAAKQLQVEVPHYCYHRNLSVAGNCRMCLVKVGMPKRAPDGSMAKTAEGKPEIGFMPKLQIGCATPVAEGMVVETRSSDVQTARKGVMEFLLINHPLDCPICDQAGECRLQEFAVDHGAGESRFVELKVHSPKRCRWARRSCSTTSVASCAHAVSASCVKSHNKIVWASLNAAATSS